MIEAAAVPDILCREVTLPNGLPLSPVEIDGAALALTTDVAVCRGVALLKGLALTLPIVLIDPMAVLEVVALRVLLADSDGSAVLLILCRGVPLLKAVVVTLPRGVTV